MIPVLSSTKSTRVLNRATKKVDSLLSGFKALLDGLYTVLTKLTDARSASINTVSEEAKAQKELTDKIVKINRIIEKISDLIE